MIKKDFFITNTLSGKKEKFEPIEKDKVKMYVCGVTPYDYAHIGHGRVYVTFDVLYRLLNFLEYKVSYCRNFTDIDDKIINKAQQEFNDKFQYSKISERYINAFHEDIKTLDCLSPDYEPKVTEVIPEIIEFVQGLIDKKMAYEVDGDVYFEIKALPDYGKLSKRKLEDLKSGARIEVDTRKRDPLDFALWKSEPEGQFFKSPWGYGRPGWHIECSAMALKFLGEHIDIHGGGMDLIFPHHENEVAQSEGLFGPVFARYWIHNAFVRINKEKMSKSLNNFFTLRDVFKQFDPMVIRFYYINHNYNIPMDFSFEDLESTKKSYQKLCKVFDGVSLQDIDIDQASSSLVLQKMLSFLCDDLNMAGMLGVVFENINILENDKQQASLIKSFFNQVMGLKLIKLEEPKREITPEIQKLIDERIAARAEKNWKKSDEIRDKLKEMGIEVQDKIVK
ncbi:MAG: cysteine--tRNA ligase [Candidatus Babeliales bacterium]|nr:cysteine--tRNA ligase [Candidatus Babeliales bacterium]